MIVLPVEGDRHQRRPATRPIFGCVEAFGAEGVGDVVVRCRVATFGLVSSSSVGDVGAVNQALATTALVAPLCP